MPQLMQKCGFARTHHYKWKKQQPTTESLRRIAAATGVNLHWIIKGEGQMRAGPRPDIYPNRTSAIATARAWNVSESAIAKLYDLDPGEDPSPAWWFSQLPLPDGDGSK